MAMVAMTAIPRLRCDDRDALTTGEVGFFLTMFCGAIATATL